MLPYGTVWLRKAMISGHNLVFESYKMIKNDLIDNIRAEIGGLSTREVWTYTTFIVDEMAKALERGESIKIVNFGVFESYNKKERIGRNPKTLEDAMISARRVVRFRMSDSLFEIFNPEERK